MIVKDNIEIGGKAFVKQYSDSGFYIERDGVQYLTGMLVQYDGKLYRVIQPHTSQPDWTPDKVPALFVRVSAEEFPEWVQPTGAHDAYNKGDKVTHNGLRWISAADSNVWEPGVYGWTNIN